MMRKKKYKSIETVKSRYGLMFISPFVIGFFLFFAIPLLQSLWYSFCSITFDSEGVSTTFKGFKPYRTLLLEDPDYTKLLTSSVTTVFYSLPIILLLSLVLALLLNQKFKGRLLFRAIYFMPVIIATGVVIDLMFQTTSSDLEAAGVSDTFTGSMLSVADIVQWLNLPDKVAVYIRTIISNIFDLVWGCGIQTVLFIAGLQSIPRSLYEASHIEGASKWEEFWFITFPMLSNITFLVAVYTLVDLFTTTRNVLVDKAYVMMNSGIYDVTSSMLWFYFAIVAIIMSVILSLYQRILMKRWQ